MMRSRPMAGLATVRRSAVSCEDRMGGEHLQLQEGALAI